MSTIVGPANLWEVNVVYLWADLMFWLSIGFAGVVLILYKLKD
jgi:hypothetical protein